MSKGYWEGWGFNDTFKVVLTGKTKNVSNALKEIKQTFPKSDVKKIDSKSFYVFVYDNELPILKKTAKIFDLKFSYGVGGNLSSNNIYVLYDATETAIRILGNNGKTISSGWWKSNLSRENSEALLESLKIENLISGALPYTGDASFLKFENGGNIGEALAMSNPYIGGAKTIQGIAPKSFDAIDMKLAKKINPDPNRPIFFNNGGLILYTNNDYNNKIANFKTLLEAKKYAKANKWKYDNMIFEYENGDNIIVNKSDTFKDIDWLFSENYSKGGSLEYVNPNEKNYYFSRFEGAIGSFAWLYNKKYNEGILYPLDDFDKEYYSHLKLKVGEKLFRYTTEKNFFGEKFLIKINLEKSLLYFMSEYNDTDDKNVVFESRGVKAEYITLDKTAKFSLGGGVDEYINIDKMNPKQYEIVTNFNTLKSLAKNGFIELHENTGLRYKNYEDKAKSQVKGYVTNVRHDYIKSAKQPKFKFNNRDYAIGYIKGLNFLKLYVLKDISQNKFDNGGTTGSTDYSVAQTILNQLGGMKRLVIMTGAYNFVASSNAVSFRIKNRKVNYVKITLNGKDLYDIKFSRIFNYKEKIVKEFDDLYFDQLIPIFEQTTGMYLKMFKKGGYVNTQNRDMIISQLKTIHHHELELLETLKSSGEVEAWVLSKISNASQDLSDVAHYLEFKN